MALLSTQLPGEGSVCAILKRNQDVVDLLMLLRCCYSILPSESNCITLNGHRLLLHPARVL